MFTDTKQEIVDALISRMIVIMIEEDCDQYRALQLLCGECELVDKLNSSINKYLSAI